MKCRTGIVLFLMLFNAGWLLHVFVVLYLKGYYPIHETNRVIAGIEVFATMCIAGLAIERMVNLRER